MMDDNALWTPPHWHASWQKLLTRALRHMDLQYLRRLKTTTDWLPGPQRIFSAFSLPLPKVRYILFGESPYPRAISANGYAFWDNSVKQIWSPTGLSKEVNRATSLRNFMKMLLLAEGKLSDKDISPTAIGQLDKSHFVQKLPELFQHLLNHGFLLLNATLAWHNAETVREEAKQWQPFMQSLLEQIYHVNPNITLVLFGNIARQIDRLTTLPFPRICAEHPYNLSFIRNKTVQEFFAPLKLLQER